MGNGLYTLREVGSTAAPRRVANSKCIRIATRYNIEHEKRERFFLPFSHVSRLVGAGEGIAVRF